MRFAVGFEYRYTTNYSTGDRNKKSGVEGEAAVMNVSKGQRQEAQSLDLFDLAKRASFLA
jgi:hypothetical protein